VEQSFHDYSYLTIPFASLSLDFALVTVSGSLVVYNMNVAMKSLVKVAAHTGDATSLDWHPTRPYVIATGGSGDRCVKGEKNFFQSL
jgi:hypothetical protein